MKITLEKSTGRAKCRSSSCKKMTIYISGSDRIKVGTTCAAITMDSAAGVNTSYYCRDCIDQLYLDIKAILNPALWKFL